VPQEIFHRHSLIARTLSVRTPKTEAMMPAKNAAREVVDRAEPIALSERDTARVLHLLENPPEPTPALMAAARRRLGRK